jgi:hypothetical protein
VRVLASEELAEHASRRALAWGDGDDLAWRETLRAHLAAEGSALRRSLLDRVLRWHGADSAEVRERVNALLDDLDAIGDVWIGDGGLVGAAPLRAALVAGSGTALLLGSIPTAALARALPGEVIERRRVRRVVLTCHDAEGLAQVMAVIGGRVIDAAVWAGLDRAPVSPSAWRGELDARRVDDAAPDGDREVFVAGPRSRWRRETEAVGLPRLERFRQPGGWFRFVWRRSDGAVALTADEAARTTLALEAAAGHARRVAAEGTVEGNVTFNAPGWLPRAEYRLLLGSCDRVVADDGAARYVASRAVWPALAAALRDRLGMNVDEAGVLR